MSEQKRQPPSGRFRHALIPTQKVKKGTAKRLFGYVFKGNILKFAAVILGIGMNALTTVYISFFIKTLVAEIQVMVQKGSVDFGPLKFEIIKMTGVFLFGITGVFIQNLLMAKISQGVLRKVRDDMFHHLQKLPISYYDKNTHGDIMSHFTNDTDTLRQMVAQTLPQLVTSFVTIIAVFVSMIVMSPYLTIFVVVSVALMMLVTSRVARRSGTFFIRQQDSLGDVNGYIEEMMKGQKVIKVFNHEDEIKEEFDKRNEELFKNTFNANRYVNILGPLNNNFGHLQYVLIAVIGGAMAVFGAGSMTLATVAGFLNLSKSFLNPINQVSQQINSIVMALAGAERIFELLDEEEEQDSGYVTLVRTKENADGTVTETDEHTGTWAWKHPHKDGTLTYTPLRGEVKMFDVDFSYDGKNTVLKNVSLYAHPGQKVAFVGATGAGKTTITNLLNRFYDIADGKIRYDGININKIKKSDLRRSLGMVLQDTNLFTGTVMENIRYGNLDATDEQVYEAAKLAGADEFIRHLPEGYDTVLKENGANISQGQRQLISIARAAIADPPVMIMDEATSSIDTRTEAAVQRGMDALMHGRTVFIIAHRLSTVQNSDCIMVLDHGEIIERGDHYQLIKQKGMYYQLYTGAFQLE